MLTIPVPCISESYIKRKIKFLFSHLFVVSQRFYGGLKDIHKTFWDTTNKCKNKIKVNFFCPSEIGTGRVKNSPVLRFCKSEC